MKIKNLFLAATLIAFLSTALFSQGLIQYPVAGLKLKIEQYDGNNGAAVVFNPEEQLYYTVFAGNADYPLETFDRSGNNVYQSTPRIDMRGMWWNPKAGALEGNCYQDGGIVSFAMTEEGYAIAMDQTIFYGAEHQPDDNSVGVFDSKAKEILYFSIGAVVGFSRKSGKMGKTYVIPYLPVDLENINWNSMIFTGVEGMEYGLLDFVEKKVYLFDKKTWYQTGTVNLPKSVPTYEGYNFSFANGSIFLYNKDNREWVGYRIF